MRRIGIMLIVVTALLCYGNGWAESPTKEEILKLKQDRRYEEILKFKQDRRYGGTSGGGMSDKEVQDRRDVKSKTMKKIRELAPKPCVCSETALSADSSKLPVIQCQCGEVQCIVNLNGGIFCPKSGLFK
jgi:hypothetical protein